MAALTRGRSARQRSSFSISDQLDKVLTAYALAGAGALLLTSSAEAQIVFTPVNRTFDRGTLRLDLNQDGVTDFAAMNHEFYYYAFNTATIGITAHGTPSAGVVGKSHAASVLSSGATVGPSAQFIPVSHKPSAVLLAVNCFYTSCRVRGLWKDQAKKFVGLRLNINGETHYGWARFTVRLLGEQDRVMIATLFGYAYESTPNKPIVAGDRGFTADAASEDDKTDRTAGPETAALPATLGLLVRVTGD